MSHPLLAFDFGGTRGRCARVSMDGAAGPLKVLHRQAGEEGPRWLERLMDAGRALPGESPRALGVSFGGPVAPSGRVLSMHVPGWEGVDVRARMTAAFGLPCRVDNDANLGALGEHRWGAGRGASSLIYVTVSTGVGGGIILDGKLHRGSRGMAGEIGHLPAAPFSPDLPLCACGGRGCVESFASGPALARRAPPPATAETVFAAVRRGEPWALAARDAALGALARGLAAAVSLLDIGLVVIGGGVTQAGDDFFVPLRAKLEETLTPLQRGHVEVRPAALGDLAPLLGAAALAMEDLA